MPLTIVQVRNDLYSKAGVEDPSLATTLLAQDAVVAINGAMQMLQTAGERFFTQQEVSITLGAGTAAYVISSGIQAVIGPARLNDSVPLRALTSRGEYDQFHRIFFGGSDYGAPSGVPMAYLPESIRDGSTGDIVKTTIYVAPTPASAGTLNVRVIYDAPSYTTADLTSTSNLPVAQNYTESVFLPIARYLMMQSSQFSRPDIRDQITQGYQTAMQTLAQAGGFPPVPESQNRETQG